MLQNKLNENVSRIWTQELFTTVSRNKEAYNISKIQHHNSNYGYLSLTDVNIFKYMERTTCFQD